MKDRELVTLFFVEGKQHQAFRYIVQTYSERLYWHIRRIVRIHQDADDVLQNTFIKVWSKLSTFEGKSSLYSWMYRIALNEALNHLKKNQKYSLDDPEEFAQLLEADPYFDGDEAYVHFLSLVDQLPEKQKLVFQMKYFEKMKYEEIVDLLGGTVGSLKASYHHAVKKLEEKLKED